MDKLALDNGFSFIAQYEPDGNDIATVKGSVQQMSDACTARMDCIGFSSDGKLKKALKPNDQWRFVSTGCKGMFTKEADDCASREVPGYFFGQRFDSPGQTIRTVKGDLKAIADTCNKDVFCGGFNSKGQLKSDVVSEDQMQYQRNWQPCDGIYTKEIPNCGAQEIQDFEFTPGFDSVGHDIKRVMGGIKATADACKKDPDCEGFNTGGYTKSTVKEEKYWTYLPSGRANCVGTYLKI